MGEQRYDRPSSVASDIEAIDSHFNTQELFLLSSYLPIQLFSNNEERFHSSSIDTSLSLQVSAEREMLEMCSQLSPCFLIPGKSEESFPATWECAIQRENFFSSLAVSSSWRKISDCCEQPLDLSSEKILQVQNWFPVLWQKLLLILIYPPKD